MYPGGDEKIQFQGLPAETTTAGLMIQKERSRDKTGDSHWEEAATDKVVIDETNTCG